MVHDQAFFSIQNIVKVLSKKADDAVESYRIHQEEDATEMFQEANADWNTFSALGDVGYSVFRDDSVVFIDSGE